MRRKREHLQKGAHMVRVMSYTRYYLQQVKMVFVFFNILMFCLFRILGLIPILHVVVGNNFCLSKKENLSCSVSKLCHFINWKGVPSVYLSIHQSIYLLICTSIHLSIQLSVYLSINHSSFHFYRHRAVNLFLNEYCKTWLSDCTETNMERICEQLLVSNITLPPSLSLSLTPTLFVSFSYPLLSSGSRRLWNQLIKQVCPETWSTNWIIFDVPNVGFCTAMVMTSFHQDSLLYICFFTIHTYIQTHTHTHM